jgi:nucleoside-diphosphate-sugar epimerase
MKIVITGSSGQIGSNLAVRCLEFGHQVIGIISGGMNGRMRSRLSWWI